MKLTKPADKKGGMEFFILARWRYSVMALLWQRTFRREQARSCQASRCNALWTVASSGACVVTSCGHVTCDLYQDIQRQDLIPLLMFRDGQRPLPSVDFSGHWLLFWSSADGTSTVKHTSRHRRVGLPFMQNDLLPLQLPLLQIHLY